MIALRMHVILRNAIDSLMVFVIMFEIFVYLIPFDVIYIKSNNKIVTERQFAKVTCFDSDNRIFLGLPSKYSTISKHWKYSRSCK